LSAFIVSLGDQVFDRRVPVLADSGGDMDAALAFAANIVNHEYEDLPAEIVVITRNCILDTIGVMLAASTLGDGVSEIVNLVKDGGGKPESMIIANGVKVPCWMAAFANGAMTHTLDYDDVHDEGQTHPTSHALIAALAIAEKQGKVSGKAFIAAIALASDMVNRMGLAIAQGVEEHGWLSPSVLGYFSATAAAGKLLGLSVSQMESAFGIAVNQAAGSMAACYDTKSTVRAIRDSFCGKGGVLSALLAQSGIIGISDSFERKGGLFKLYFGREYKPDIMTRGLGKTFTGDQNSFKPWPTCRTTHTYLDAALGLFRQYDIRPDNIEEIVLVVGDMARPLCEPLDLRRVPKLAIGAKNSLPFVVGAAAARRKVVLGDFLPEGLNDPATLQIAQKVNYRYDVTLTQDGEPPAIVEIYTRDGKQYSRRVNRAYGNPLNPMSMEDIIAKFKDCAGYSANHLSPDTIDSLISLLTKLEKVEDMNEVIKLLG
jgi:2-methylcitrate dehydratase PrpD